MGRGYRRASPATPADVRVTSVPDRHDRVAGGLQQTVLIIVSVAVLVVAIPIALLILFLSDDRAERDERQT